MKQPTITKAVAHALTSKKTWKLLAGMWGAFVAVFVILAAFGVAGGARIEAATDYLGQMTGLCTISTTITCIGFRTYLGYKSAMRAWNAQRQVRRMCRRARRAVR